MAVKADHTAWGGVWNQQYRQWEWRDHQGRWHRVDGPAYIHATGHQEWWLHGQRHRVDGPAYISDKGHQEWYVHDRAITAEVTAWLLNNNIALPFTADQQAEFALRWL